MPAYNNDADGSYLVAEELSKKGINLPSSPNLTEQEIRKICRIIKEVVMER
jgi:dTDP-4-amino-4,6-dideoxygalactose transaminase